MRMVSLMAFCVLVSASLASAQTTRPAQPEAWPQVAQALATALSTGDRTGVDALLAEHPSIRTFTGVQYQESASLLERVGKGTLLGCHAYIDRPLAMAADIAADFKSASGVPDAVKDRMSPADDSAMKQANATAVQWLTDAVGAREGQAVGVAEFWSVQPAVGAVAGSPEAVFVLFRGEEIAPGQFRIKSIAFGHPLDEGN